MKVKKTLKDILIKTVEQKLLSFMLNNPDKVFYMKEIAEYAKISSGGISKAIRALNGAGLINLEQKGKAILCKLDNLNLYIKKYKVLHAVLMLEPLIGKLQSISRRCILFGSFATGTYGSGSDIDLLIISERKADVLRVIDSFKADLKFCMSPVVKSELEWLNIMQTNVQFYNEINKGIVLFERSNESI